MYLNVSILNSPCLTSTTADAYNCVRMITLLIWGQYRLTLRLHITTERRFSPPTSHDSRPCIKMVLTAQIHPLHHRWAGPGYLLSTLWVFVALPLTMQELVDKGRFTSTRCGTTKCCLRPIALDAFLSDSPGESYRPFVLSLNISMHCR